MDVERALGQTHHYEVFWDLDLSGGAHGTPDYVFLQSFLKLQLGFWLRLWLGFKLGPYCKSPLSSFEIVWANGPHLSTVGLI